MHLNELVDVGEDQRMRLISEGEAAPPLRAVHVPADIDGKGGEGTFLLFDEREAPGAAQFGRTCRLCSTCSRSALRWSIATAAS